MKPNILDYRNYLYLSLDKFNRFLKKEDIAIVKLNIKLSDKSSFCQHYQERYTSVPNSKSYTLKEILEEALPNSENKFEQYDININRVKELTRLIFVEDNWLTKDIVVGDLEGNPYLIGGRHRTFAIAHVFALLAKNNCKDEENIQSLFEEYLKQLIRVNYIEIRDPDYLLPLLIKDNDSRRMKKVELYHLEAQALGADADGIESISRIVLDTEKPKDAIKIAGQYFARRHHIRIKPRALQEYGEHIAKWILYGLRYGNKLTNKKTTNITTEEFETGMGKAWDILVEIAEEKDAKINTGIVEISKRIIEKLSQENSKESKELVAAQ